MRFYKVNVLNGETGESWNSWFTNRREAKRYYRKAKREEADTYQVFDIFEYDIPINKAGLLAWLNSYCHPSIGYH